MAWALVGLAGSAVISGVSSYLGQQRAERDTKDQIKNEMEAIRVQGDEERTNLAYQSALNAWRRNKLKYRQQQGAKNWATYGRATPSAVGPGLGALMNHTSTSGTPDPGDMPGQPGSTPGLSPQGGALAQISRTRR